MLAVLSSLSVLSHLEFSRIAALAEIIALVNAVEALFVCAPVWTGFASQSYDPLPGFAHLGSRGENALGGWFLAVRNEGFRGSA